MHQLRLTKQVALTERRLSAIPHLADYPQDPRQISSLKGGRHFERPPQHVRNGRVSVITAVRNASTTLERTIDSLRAQSYSDIEYIIVDGGSTDGTVDILKQRSTDIDFWLSEPDRGISDAFNKGIALSTGEFVALVNADDWLESHHIAQSIDSLASSTADFSFGNLVLHDNDGVPLFSILGDAQYSHRLHHAMPAFNHPTMICRRALYARNGLYDLSYRVAMDYEWLLRNHLRGAIGVYVSDLTSHMGADGLSQRQIRLSLLEVRRASVTYGYPSEFALMRFYARLLKAQSRQLLEKIMPQHVVDRMRRLVNPRFRCCATVNQYRR